MKTRLSYLAALFVLALCVSFTLRPAADGWVSIFDGKDLDGWKVGNNASTFSVENGVIRVMGPTAHLFYEGPVHNHDFKNFEWKASVKTMPGANSGMFIHTAFQEGGWPKKGYEIQVNQSKQFVETTSLHQY